MACLMATLSRDEVAHVARLARLDFEHAVFGHGGAITGEAAERFREYAA